MITLFSGNAMGLIYVAVVAAALAGAWVVFRQFRWFRQESSRSRFQVVIALALLAIGALFAWSLACLCIGMAEGAIDLYVGAMRKRRHAYDGKPVALDPHTQLKLGEAVAMANAALATQQKDFAEMMAYIHRDGAIPKSARIGYKSNAAFAARMATDALTKVVKAAGGSAFSLSNQLQRMFRDIHTGSNHAFINPDRGASNHGAFLLADEILDFVI